MNISQTLLYTILTLSGRNRQIVSQNENNFFESLNIDFIEQFNNEKVSLGILDTELNFFRTFSYLGDENHQKCKLKVAI